ncbi:hypothetical protein ABH922_005131 [Rhodococcus sp. 27YEA15]|uniref:histone-like nucleoid-structuring protein Lsr2 n=1 Tax=Rhodococcus sp. 27YEA15 TaxID=3156259 RepID=UPI003C79D335
MAEIMIRQLIDDLDGNVIEDGYEDRIEFSYQGIDYVIDLRATNSAKLDAAMAPYVKAAMKVGSRRARKEPVTKKVTGSGRSAEQLGAVRDWATINGYEVSPRGRIKTEIIAAFDAAH